MELLFNSTDEFEKDLNKFDDQERSKIIAKLNIRSSTFLKDGFKDPDFYRPLDIKLHNGYEPSLYSIRVGEDIRIILTVDDDPLFDQIIITLMRVIRRKDLEKIFRDIAESLYQNDINSISINRA